MGFFTEGVHHFIITLDLVMPLNLYFFVKKYSMITTTKEVKKMRNPKVYTLEEYLRREEKAVEKHEFYNGKIVRKPSVNVYRSSISVNICTAIHLALRPFSNPFHVYDSSLKIYVEPINTTVYPTSIMVSEEPEFWQDRRDVIVNPLLIVEVLSPSSQAYDRLGKFELYKLLPSFQEYVLVNADKYSVETRFQEETNLWRIKTETDIDNSINIRSLGITISMADIYEDVVFNVKKDK